MMSRKVGAALAASVALMWGSAHAAPEAAEMPPAQVPEVIILELQPVAPGEATAESSAQEQAMLGMLLMQLLGAMQAEGENVEVQFVAPPSGERI